MKFTVITPNLNYAHFLEDCLSSVADQEGVELEHIIMDGGSTDESEALVKKYTHARWIQQSDNGMSQAINRGFNQAKGDWVMWLNADDRLKPQVLTEIVEELEGANTDVVYGDFDFMDADGGHLRTVRLPGWSPFVHVHHQCYIGSTAAFYSRSTVVDEGFRLREDFHYVMDGEFYIRLHLAGKKFKHIPKSIADFRLHGENASMRHLGKGGDMDSVIAAEKQHVESRAIRRCHGITLFKDPYLNGIIDGFLWLLAKAYKCILKLRR